MTASESSLQFSSIRPKPSLLLKPSTLYYLRKLLRQKLEFLRFIASRDFEFKATYLKNLDSVIEKLYPNSEQLSYVLQQLECLVEVIQKLSNQGTDNLSEIQQCEEKIYKLLGFEYLPNKPLKKKVLVVDDSVEILTLLDRSFKSKGYSTYTTSNSRSIPVIANAFKPDLILLDVNMPGMNGYDVCKQLKQYDSTRNIPVIFISSSNGTDHRKMVSEAGGVTCITKPLNSNEITKIVENYL